MHEASNRFGPTQVGGEKHLEVCVPPCGTGVHRHRAVALHDRAPSTPSGRHSPLCAVALRASCSEQGTPKTGRHMGTSFRVRPPRQNTARHELTTHRSGDRHGVTHPRDS